MLQILFAILAGMLTIAAPCILPLLPILLGVSVGQTSKTRPIFIVLGFVLVFASAGLLLSYLSQHIGLDPGIIRTTGVVILGLFGLFLIWSKPFDLLALRMSAIVAKAGMAGGRGEGNWGAFVLGMTLGIVWTPCAGPVLGSVLTLIALQTELATATILLVAYAIGAGLPMLLIAYGGQYLSTRVESLARYSRLIQQIFGIVIIAFAVAVYFNYDLVFYSLFLKYCPSFNPKF